MINPRCIECDFEVVENEGETCEHCNGFEAYESEAEYDDDSCQDAG